MISDVPRNKTELGWRIKTGQERVVPLLPEVVAVLRSAIGKRIAGPVFLRERLARKRPTPAGDRRELALHERRAAVGKALTRGEKARLARRADQFFGPESGSHVVVVEADAGHTVEAEFRAAGWQVFEDEPALVLPSIPAQPHPVPAGLEVRQVSDDAGRRDLGRVLALGFGSPTAEGKGELPPEAQECLVPSLECACDPDVALLVG